jgi:hypothetical protein
MKKTFTIFILLLLVVLAFNNIFVSMNPYNFHSGNSFMNNYDVYVDFDERISFIHSKNIYFSQSFSRNTFNSFSKILNINFEHYQRYYNGMFSLEIISIGKNISLDDYSNLVLDDLNLKPSFEKNDPPEFQKSGSNNSPPSFTSVKPSNNILIENTIYYFGGKKGQLINYIENENIQYLKCWIVNNGKVYVFTYKNYINDFDIYLQDLMIIIDSFKIHR